MAPPSPMPIHSDNNHFSHSSTHFPGLLVTESQPKDLSLTRDATLPVRDAAGGRVDLFSYTDRELFAQVEPENS